MNIYLDVDGTILTKDKQPAQGLVEFLKHLTENHQVFWLTTHCKEGDASMVIKYLSNYFPEEATVLLSKIQATTWTTWKTEAIDFSTDFRWFDDFPLSPEIEELAKHNAQSKLIRVDLQTNPETLNNI